jgi:hypothetical protein
MLLWHFINCFFFTFGRYWYLKHFTDLLFVITSFPSARFNAEICVCASFWSQCQFWESIQEHLWHSLQWSVWVTSFILLVWVTEATLRIYSLKISTSLKSNENNMLCFLIHHMQDVKLKCSILNFFLHNINLYSYEFLKFKYMSWDISEKSLIMPF